VQQSMQAYVASNTSLFKCNTTSFSELAASCCDLANDRVREAHVRVPLYFTDVCCMKSDADFKADYRVTRPTFNKLCHLVAGTPEFTPSQSGKVLELCVG
jgi:hypothetical protein